MAIEKKVEMLEGEVKLMKGELKETLTGVRDFLLTLKLPPPQIEGLDLGEFSRVGIDGALSMDSGGSSSPPPKKVVELPPENMATQQVEQDQPAVSPVAGEQASPQLWEVETPPEPEVSEPSEEEEQSSQLEEEPLALDSSEEEEQSEQLEECEVIRLPGAKREEETDESASGQVAGTTPQVNLLPNLLRWVSVAAREIGSERLPTFLDVYGTTGNLSLETREVILRFAGVVEQQPSDAQTDNICTRLMSEQLATFLKVHSVNGNVSPEVKEGILRFISAMARQASGAHTTGVWNQLMSERLATFLEVHCANGQLSSEVKEGVMRFIGAMAPPTGEGDGTDKVPQTAEKNVADIWSQLVLELHGILAGGGTPLQALSLLQDDRENEAELGEVEGDNTEGPIRLEKGEPVKQEEDSPVRPEEDKAVTLKLVIPAGGGAEKEFGIEKFSINITPAAGKKDSSGQSSTE